MNKKILSLAVAAFMSVSMLLTGCGSQEPAKTIATVDDLAGAKIGVQLGTTGDELATAYEAQGATVERFQKGADAVQALKQGKIDCVVIDSEPAKKFVSVNDDLKVLDEALSVEEYALALAKDDTELLDAINGALAELEAEGVLNAIANNYIGDDAGKNPYVSPENVDRSNGVLTIATNAEFEPYEYMVEGEIVGIDIDIMQAVCDKLGYELKIDNIAFDSIIPAIQSGKADVGAAGMTVTEDRKQNVNFSTPYTSASQVIIVKQ